MSTYPVAFEADYVEERSRVTTFFRIILAIPLFIWGYIYGIAATVAVVIAWFAIVFTGNYPPGLFNFVSGFTRFITMLAGYLCLLTDEYPPFTGGSDAGYPVRLAFSGPLPEYSRIKTLLRIFIAIPILILRYVIQLLLEIGALGAWVVIVITGKQPRGLQEMLELGLSYTARSDAYIFLLTETYPPFTDTSGTQSATASGPAAALGDVSPAAQPPIASPASPAGPEAVAPPDLPDLPDLPS
jgi:hypothetical protein